MSPAFGTDQGKYTDQSGNRFPNYKDQYGQFTGKIDVVEGIYNKAGTTDTDNLLGKLGNGRVAGIVFAVIVAVTAGGDGTEGKHKT